MDEDRENQLAELEAIESVLKEGRLHRKSDSPIAGEIVLDFDETDAKIRGILENGEQFENDLKFLPLARLNFEFPADYPSASTPKFEIFTDWLTEEQTSKCLEELRQICADNESMPVLYFCYEKSIEFMSEVGKNDIWLNDAYVLKIEKNLSISQLRNRIIGQSEVESVDHFNHKTFECKICYDEFIGEQCYRFDPCQHVFCLQCIANYFMFLVNNELSSGLKCLAEGCQTPCDHTFIQKILNPTDFAKYEHFLLEKAIQDIENAVQCPRLECQKVAYLTDPSKNLVECSYCSSSFCNLCKHAFHGVSECRFKSEDKSAILEEWRKADSEQRKEMAKGFGGMKNLQTIIETFENDEWKEANSKQCPKCSVSIEKNEGCHKMHCTKCDTYFCWLCTKVLLKNDPYEHFRNDGECSGRLFEGVVPQNDEDDDDVDDDDDFEADEMELLEQIRILRREMQEAFDEDDDDDDDIEFMPHDNFNEAFDEGSESEIEEEG